MQTSHAMERNVWYSPSQRLASGSSISVSIQKSPNHTPWKYTR